MQAEAIFTPNARVKANASIVYKLHKCKRMRCSHTECLTTQNGSKPDRQTDRRAIGRKVARYEGRKERKKGKNAAARTL